jgi:hypothetical protein
MIYRGPGFVSSFDLAPLLSPPPSPVRSVQGDPDFEVFQLLYFSLSRKYTFRPRPKPSGMPILLGPPGCAQVFPYLSPGPLDFLVV